MAIKQNRFKFYSVLSFLFGLLILLSLALSFLPPISSLMEDIIEYMAEKLSPSLLYAMAAYLIVKGLFFINLSSLLLKPSVWQFSLLLLFTGLWIVTLVVVGWLGVPIFLDFSNVSVVDDIKSLLWALLDLCFPIGICLWIQKERRAGALDF